MEDVINVEGKQYVVFMLGKENYGVDIQKVTTIEKIMPYARVPKTPDYVKGVINLRGEIVPVMDIRTKFGMEVSEETEETRIIIIKINEISLGIIVDEVDEVLNLTEESIENVANFTNDLSMDYILGVGKVDGRIVTLLNLEKIIDISENNDQGE
ncbi:chemotaxis protein CheW [Acetivibrio cellulolyticus]|uniref:chemotaxis protein CheW n=1 Tax=Acetivibrio cellulolyticus TaxID=35830 RepID=UPI0001E2BDE5|nr:chemotaxis protein CheW [Acetivibrio cellulolyticus]